MLIIHYVCLLRCVSSSFYFFTVLLMCMCMYMKARLLLIDIEEIK